MAHPKSFPEDANASAIITEILEHPIGKNACYLMDVIDTKVSPIISYIGILFAAILIFASKDGSYLDVPYGGIVVSQAILVAFSLAVLVLASLLCLSCLNTLNLKLVASKNKALERTVDYLDKVANSRRNRYLLALVLTVLATLSVSLLVLVSITPT